MKTKLKKFSYALDVDKLVRDRYTVTIEAKTQKEADKKILLMNKRNDIISSAGSVETLDEYDFIAEPADRGGKSTRWLMRDDNGFLSAPLWQNGSDK